MERARSKKSRRRKEDESKEIERLKKCRQRAQDKGDVTEEAKLCNAIGDIYFQNCDFKKALYYHRCELALSEGGGGSGDCSLDYGIACRRVGECCCELGDYREAVEYQKKHLLISRQLRNRVEEQRALATLGRTLYVWSQSELERRKGRDRASEFLVQAGTYYLQSLELCDQLIGQLSDRELLEMRSRLYLNLGLVYEMQEDLQSAKRFMEKALSILKELGDSITVFQCHFDLGSLHLKERHTSQALRCFQEALSVAREHRNRTQEIDALKEVAQVYLELSEFEHAKSCFKRVLKLSESLNLPCEDVKKQLKAVRMILYYMAEVEKSSDGEDGTLENKARLYDKLGDLCCGLKAYSSAVKFYGKQLGLAEELDLSVQELSAIYVSLARTLVDCGQFSQALLYYNKELKVLKGKPAEECDSWCNIADVREKAGQGVEKVMEAYTNATALAEQVHPANPKKQISLYKVIIKYISDRAESTGGSSALCHPWQQKLSQLLESHPSLADEDSDDEEDEKESQGLDEVAGDVPHDLDFSLSSSEEGEEEEEVGVVSMEKITREAVVRKKSKLEKKNERGETLLQTAVINGDLLAVKRLINKGAKVMTRDHCGWTPLHEACNHGYEDIVGLLIENGAVIDDPGGANCEGMTPLIDAAINGHEGIVKLLIGKGANLACKDTHGRTALDVIEDRLSSVADSGQSYELEEEHLGIRDTLRAEMRRCGLYVKEDTPPSVTLIENQEEEEENSMTCSRIIRYQNTGRKNREKKSVGGVAVKGDKNEPGGGGGDDEGQSCMKRKRQKPKHSSRHERWGSGVLYDSSDDDDDDGNIGHKIIEKTRENPFRNFIVTAGTSSSASKNYNKSLSSTSIRKDRSHGTFNPLGQVEISGPALIQEEVSEELDEATGCPVIDNWLVDDIGEGPTRKRKRQQRDSSVERESRAFIGLSSSSLSSNSGSNRGRNFSLPRTTQNRAPSVSELANSRRTSMKCKAQDKDGGAREKGGGVKKVRFSEMVDLSGDGPDITNTNDSDSDVEEDFKRWERNREQIGDTSTSGVQLPSILPFHVSTLPSIPPPSHYALPPPPLRIKVRIENSTYLIPCPHQVDNEKDTPINWLITQATERYFSQKGKRPILSLTTVDGASLCPADPIAHVLGQGDEVVGVVEEFFSPPLVERYQMACRTAGVECHTRTLELFEKHSHSPSLDLLNFDLQPCDSIPLFQALHAHNSLTSISLSGNRLRDESMTHLLSALGKLPLLHSLDLSSTGITYQGIDSLSRSPPTSVGDQIHLWQSLHTLNLSHNKLGVASGRGLGKLFSLCRRLQEVHLDSCGLSHDVLEANTGLAEALKSLVELRVLSLSKNPLGGSGLCFLFSTLHELRVTSLNISRVISTKMTRSQPFSQVLKENATLRYFREGSGQYLEILDVSYCSHGDGKALGALVDCLEHCLGLRELRVAGWGLIAQHIEPLCSYLSLSDCLDVLDVSGNVSLGNRGTLQLLNACSSRFSLEEDNFKLDLNLVACGIESPLSDEFIRIVQLLKHTGRDETIAHALFKVDLSGNLIDKREMNLFS